MSRNTPGSSFKEECDVERPSLFIRSYFNYDPEINKSYCGILNCNASLSGKHLSNLEKHIKRKHPEEAFDISYKRRLHQEALANKKTDKNTTSSESRDIGKLEQKRREVVSALVTLTTIDGRPLSIVEDVGMRELLEMVINDSELCTTMTKKSILEEIQCEATKWRILIKNQLKGLLLSLKLDISTKLSRSILGVSVQYIYKGEVMLRNLCVMELLEEATDKNLSRLVTDILAEYHIDPNTIYFIATDTAASTIKIDKVKETIDNKLSTDLSETELSDIKKEEFDIDSESDSSESPSIRNFESLFQDSTADITVEDEANRWSNLFNSIPNHFLNQNTISFRCAPHLLELAVSDALNSEEISDLLNDAREICRKLRTESSNKLLSPGRIKPTLDSPNKWYTSIDMISNLLAIRDINGNLFPNDDGLTESQWDSLQAVLAILKTVKVAVMRLQTEQLLVGEFVEIWLRCKCDIQHILSPITEVFCNAMEVREKALFNNPSIFNAIYMDPRWHIILSDEQKRAAETHLLQVWNRLESLKHSSSTDRNASTASTSNLDFDLNSDNIDPVELILVKSEFKMITRKLHDFSKTKRIPRSENVIAYWQKNRFREPELYEIAMTVLAVPVTQFTIQRIFSNIPFILKNLPRKLQDTTTNDILLVRCNRLLQNK